uniref:hypothetical protein n=1 Tax=Nonomuraea sp. CA-251285 TaxID=3240002 RepID=UPI003F493F96
MTASLKIRFESTECGRCGGTGSHQWNQIDGDICYGCRRKGRVLTKAGSAARQAYDALIDERCTKPVEELKAGEMVWRKGEAPVFGILPMFSRSGWYEIVASYHASGDSSWTLDFGPSKDDQPRVMGVQPGTRFRVPSPEAVEQIMREVAAKYAGATLITSEGEETEYEAEQSEADAKKAAERERRRAKAEEKRAAERVARDAERLAARAAWREANPDLAAYLDGVEPHHEMDERRGPALWIAEIAARAENFALSPKEVAHLRKLIDTKARDDAKQAASAHFGTVGQREAITATLEGRKDIGQDAMSRTKYLVTLTEATGATLKTFTTGSWIWDYEEGDTVTCSAIIVKHGEFRGMRETVIKDVRPRKAK